MEQSFYINDLENLVELKKRADSKNVFLIGGPEYLDSTESVASIIFVLLLNLELLICNSNVSVVLKFTSFDENIES